ncbi:MAG: hypothetical protein D6730_00410 [Bacteroidetes bacterium]|nr:MAG: hypothetical protein D6730_00410 [Bacteroidota bacterium]
MTHSLLLKLTPLFAGFLTGKRRKWQAACFFLPAGSLYGALLCSGLFFCSLSPAQSLLDIRISIEAHNQPLEQVLEEIEQAGGFRFSYNYQLIPVHKKVSIRAENQPVRSVLAQLLPPSRYQYEVYGQHLIISRVRTRSADASQASSPPIPVQVAPPPVQLSGVVRHARTGAPLAGVRIELAPDVQTFTDEDGSFQLSLPGGVSSLRLRATHPDFEPEVRVFPLPLSAPLQLQLHPLHLSSIPPEVAPPVKVVQWDSINPVEDIFVVKMLVKEELLEEKIDREEFLYRPYQFTLLPPLGTNGLKTGRTFNSFSFNLLVGYAAGLNGLEVGGGLNVVRYHANGLQLAGVGNVVGGRSSGIQFGGVLNVNTGTVNGFQLAGLHNFADSIQGGQVSAVYNLVRGQMVGVQFGGIFNMATGPLRGLSLAGFGNLSTRRVEGGQLSLGFNAAKSLKGFQLSPAANVTTRELRGVQAGLVNVAGEVRGFQLGLVNIADTVQWGAPLGLLNFVRNGYNRFELGASESFYVQAGLKMGVHRFYNLFALSFHPRPRRWALGYGFGSMFSIHPKLSLNTDLLSQYVFEQPRFPLRLNLLNQAHLGLSFHLSRRHSLFAGPTFNLHLSEKLPDGQPISRLAPYQLIDFSAHNQTHRLHLSAWIGGRIGVRL